MQINADKRLEPSMILSHDRTLRVGVMVSVDRGLGASRRPFRQHRQPLHGFTLIELLVVVTIIIALLAILMPALGRAVEVTQRAICASNQHQVHTLVLSYAADNTARFPDGVRNPSYNQHASWISQNNFKWMAERLGVSWDPGLSPVDVRDALREDSGIDVLFCPNMRQWWGYHAAGARLGFYYLYGHNISSPKLPWIAEANPWNSPSGANPGQRTIGAGGRPDWYMLADIIERGTIAPAATSVAHSRSGYMNVANLVDPRDLQVEGSNVTYLDGSTQWKSFDEMYEHSATSTGDIRGWW